jgi:segregation and condensation protein B
LDKLTLYIESLIFASTESITLKQIEEALLRFTGEQYTEDLLVVYLDQIKKRYQEDNDQFMELIELSGGFQFMTKVEYSGLIQAHLKNINKKKLSKAAMETLAVIAYKQPVSKPEIERIRGVGCDYAIQKLLEKEYVAITGRADTPGKPILYGTSEKFMDHFGLSSITDLPTMKEMITADSEVGEAEPIEMITEYLEENEDGSTTGESDSEE